MPVKMLFLDVDGVLTDGGVVLGDMGEVKTFHSRDGVGLELARRAGIAVHLVTARDSSAVRKRAEELSLEGLHTGAKRKRDVVESVLAEAGVSSEDAAFIGDDLVDLPAMQAVGTAIAVADAPQEVRAAAAYVTSVPGGRGAARDAVEWILKGEGRWDSVVADYLASIS